VEQCERDQLHLCGREYAGLIRHFV
jgi:hypothetical protein